MTSRVRSTEARGTARERLPRLAVTLGDPRGIGPEITAAALADPAIARLADFVVVGPRGTGDWPDLRAVGDWSDAAGVTEAGRLAGRAIEAATKLALAGEVDGIVTAPIDKAALRDAGYRFPGHTEMLQSLCGAPRVGMMMSAERTLADAPLRVVLATTHLALRDVAARLTSDLFVSQAELTAASLRDWWRITQPRLAICAVNPHASDGGLFGDEEERVLGPAVERLNAAGIRVTGPVPADTVFARALNGEFDAVIAPYHDVGMAAFKTVSFGSGVNVTLGLPFPRTSPDHGTALDIAGRGIARADSMMEAVRTAARLAVGFDTLAGRR